MRYSATGHAKKLTLGVWAKLGKLSPYGQKLALQVILPGASAANPVTPKDVNWEAVSKALKPLRSPSYRVFLYTEEMVKATYSEGIRSSPEEKQESFLETNREVLEKAYPAYFQNMAFEELKKLSRGESLQSLTANVLTKKEAHAYYSCYTGPRHPFCFLGSWGLREWPQWAVEESRKNAKLFEKIAGYNERDPECLPVVRWLREVLLTPAKSQVLLATRTVNHPVHGELSYCLDSRLDEIQAIDLGEKGHLAPVQAVFDNAARRFQEEQNQILSEDHNVLCPAWPCELPDGVQHLTTPSMLVAEGKRMQHCVGGYHRQVAAKTSHVFHVASETAAGTLELDSAGNIRQLYGFKNTKPTCLDLIAKAKQVSEDFIAHLWKSSEWADEVSC
jgi:hypothetical protein